MDLRTQQAQILNLRIPLKRKAHERGDADMSGDSDDERTMQNGDSRGNQFNNGGDNGGSYSKKRQNNGYQSEQFGAPTALQVSQIADITKNLPIARHKNSIIKKINKHRVLVISGDTGCGKTTQVPKYIMEEANFKKQECKIICTQPRRLAAINIAKRVSSELGERVGQTVGYHVGMQSKKTKGLTKILFMTTGIFLQRLVNNPDSIMRCSHIIMDEVHERDLDIDFSLVVIKHLLCKQAEGMGFKLILMSATFNIELFSNYFSKSAIMETESIDSYIGAEEKQLRMEEEKRQKNEKDWGPSKPGDWDTKLKSYGAQKQEQEEDEWVEQDLDAQNKMPIEKKNDPAEVIEINARLFKVEEFYLDAIVKNMKSDTNIRLTAQDRDLLDDSLTISDSKKPNVKESTMRVASIIICDIIQKINAFGDDENNKKSVLVFLPGLYEIFEFQDFLMEWYDPNWVKSVFDLIPLHSSLGEEEQERAFKLRTDGKRKIIIATNIAESSITIPDVKYVIDFMLTKELYYDPMTKSESLILSWVSKASSKQRSGRAGRVADGMVFRLCTKPFYNNCIPEYPKPEMQRCPLEKLILQVKLWNKYEPADILGRAIQPPEFRDVCNAIKNLQQTGALTIPPQNAVGTEQGKVNITALGRIFVNLPCDLKITRLFLFGMALKCMSQAIIMGCIHQQSRSIFRTNRNTDQVNLTKLQCMYDDNRDSDSIMLMRVFQEWIYKFHPHLRHKPNIPNAPQMMVPGRGREIEHRRLRFARITPQERTWCRDRNLDYNILKEVATTIEEIRYRFTKMNISERCLNSKVKLKDDNPEAILILKTCIGGAFYNKYVKAAYKYEDQLSRIKNSKVFDDEQLQRTLILNKMSEHINEAHLKTYFENKFKVPVEKIMISIDKPTIIFGPELLKKGFIKACFKLGLKNRMSRYRKLQEEEFEDTTKFRSKIFSEQKAAAKNVYFSYDEVKEMLDNEELRRPCYLYELRFETINKESYVDFELESINNFTYETNEKMLPHVTYACQDYHDRGGRFSCRNSTRLPAVPMVDAIFSMLFAPQVQIKADEKKLYFAKIICDNGETMIKLTHILTHQDLELAQKVRTMLNETLCNEDNLKQAHLAQVDFYVKRLLSFNRLPIDVYSKLCDIRQDEEKLEKQKQMLIKQQQKAANGGGGSGSWIDDDVNFFLEDDNMDLEEEKQGDVVDNKPIKDNLDTIMAPNGITTSSSLNGMGVNSLSEYGFPPQDLDVCEDNESFEVMERRQLRYEKECAMGYFLQPIQVQTLKKKIYLYDDLVQQMQEDFKQKITAKRATIARMKQKMKEYSLNEVLMICARCNNEVAPLRTFDFISEDLHFAKCVFGTLKRVDLKEAMTDPLYQEDLEFIELYMEYFQAEYEEIKKVKQAQEQLENGNITANYGSINDLFAFSKCRSNHILGIVKEQKFFITEISPVKLMFPNGQYETWDSRFWQRGYTEAMATQEKALSLRAQACQQTINKGFNGYDSKLMHPIRCELCNMTCNGPDEFVAHCQKHPLHKELETKFTSSSFDYLFDPPTVAFQAPPTSATTTHTMISVTTNTSNQHHPQFV